MSVTIDLHFTHHTHSLKKGGGVKIEEIIWSSTVYNYLVVIHHHTFTLISLLVFVEN